MADGGDEIFVYLGEQRVPYGTTHAIIDPSVNIVRRGAFAYCYQLVSVIFHDGVEIIEEHAFEDCTSLPSIKFLGVREIGHRAFHSCVALSDVKFGDTLETVRSRAFDNCGLMSIKLPSARTVQGLSFSHCNQLTDVEFGINLERIGFNSFYNCPNLQRIAIPLKDGILPFDSIINRYNQFDQCGNLTRVDIVGAEGIHKTISSLLLESWKDEMNEEIDRISRELPSIRQHDKGDAIRLWIRSVIDRMEQFKAEHDRLLKEHMTQLELAIWKAKLNEKDDDSAQKIQAKRAKIDEESIRKEKRITSGADIIIKNVVPFLKLQ